MLTAAGNQIEEYASMSMFESLRRREDYESQMSRDNPLTVRIRAFLAYNSAYLMCILMWILWMGFIMAWAMLQVPEWDIGRAQYFAISLCSSAGSFSLPTSSSYTAYGLAGLSMMIGVPLMAMGVSSVIIMLWQGHRFQKVKLAAWEDVTQEELKLLNELGVVEIGEGEELTKGGFILLGLLRMGQDVGVIKYLADAHETIQDRGGVIIRETSDANIGTDGTGYYSKHAQALIGDNKDDINEMVEFTSQRDSGASTLTTQRLSDASTVATVESRTHANDRSWSTTAGFDSGSSRNLSGGGGGTGYDPHLDTIKESSLTLSKASTAAATVQTRTHAKDRKWSTSVGYDANSARNFSGLSQVSGGGGNDNDHNLDTIEESLVTTSTARRRESDDNNGTIPSRLDSDIGSTIPSRLESDVGTSMKSKDSWHSNIP